MNKESNKIKMPVDECLYNKDGSIRDIKFRHKLMTVNEILAAPQFNIIENESKEQTISLKKSGKK